MAATFTITPHARQRMAARGIGEKEVTALLADRRHDVYRSHPGTHDDWRYRHVDADGLVVVADGPHVITVFRCQN